PAALPLPPRRRDTRRYRAPECGPGPRARSGRQRDSCRATLSRTFHQGETAVPFYEKGDVRIRYEMVGSGFPLLATPGGGLNSRVSNWPTAVFNAMEACKDDFGCITMDQRNANGGGSAGPSATGDPGGAFADDQR